MMRLLLPFLLPLLLVVGAAPAAAASFDCARAASLDEKAVCADRGLNDRDVRMALLFALDQRFLPMGGRDTLRRDQSAWLRGRRTCNADRLCLRRRYDARIAVLQAVIDERVYPQGPF
jgi:uncharacterized protein